MEMSTLDSSPQRATGRDEVAHRCGGAFRWHGKTFSVRAFQPTAMSSETLTSRPFDKVTGISVDHRGLGNSGVFRQLGSRHRPSGISATAT